MKNHKNFELSMTIGRLRDLDDKWIRYYDAVYLGEPFCEHMMQNILNSKDDLGKCIDILKANNKKVYLSIYGKPRMGIFRKAETIIDYAKTADIDAVEVFEPGMLNFIHRQWPDLDIHINGFLNVFNSQSAGVLKAYNVSRISPSFELSLDEISEIKDNSKVKIELQVFGKIPLGYAEGCVLTREYINSSACPARCYKSYFLDFSDKSMRIGPRSTWSGKDTCLLTELPELITKGFNTFRVEAHLENNYYREKAGMVYRDAILEIIENGKINFLPGKLKVLNEISEKGLCNGYLHGHAGNKLMKFKIRR